MDGWKDRQMDGLWIHRWVNEQVDGQMDGWICKKSLAQSGPLSSLDSWAQISQPHVPFPFTFTLVPLHLCSLEKERLCNRKGQRRCDIRMLMGEEIEWRIPGRGRACLPVTCLTSSPGAIKVPAQVD